MPIVPLVMILAQGAAAAPPAPPQLQVATPGPARPPADRGEGRPPVPVGNPGDWVTSADYPALALRNAWQGRVGFLLTVDPEGRVSHCDVVASSGMPVLDQATCALLLARASFTPARDARGKPMLGSFRSAVRWVLPDDAGAANAYAGEDGKFMLLNVSYRFFIEPDGSTSDCVVTIGDTTMQSSDPGSPCAPGMKYKPFTDAAGKPVRRRVHYSLVAELDPASPR